MARNFKYRNDGGDLADVAETITNENNQVVLQEHPIDVNADDHNEIVEWQNDDAHEGEEAIIAVENDRHNDEANDIIGYFENGPANLAEANLQERQIEEENNPRDDHSSNGSDGHMTPAGEAENVNTDAEAIVNPPDDNPVPSNEPIIDPQANRHPMRLRERQNIDYAVFNRKGVKQFLQKAKTNAKKTGKKYKVKVRDMFRKVVALTMTQIKSAAKHEQVSVKEGIKRFGDKAINTVLTEYAQLNEKNVFDPVDARKLTKQ